MAGFEALFSNPTSPDATAGPRPGNGAREAGWNAVSPASPGVTKARRYQLVL